MSFLQKIDKKDGILEIKIEFIQDENVYHIYLKNKSVKSIIIEKSKIKIESYHQNHGELFPLISQFPIKIKPDSEEQIKIDAYRKMFIQYPLKKFNIGFVDDNETYHWSNKIFIKSKDYNQKPFKVLILPYDNLGRGENVGNISNAIIKRFKQLNKSFNLNISLFLMTPKELPNSHIDILKITENLECDLVLYGDSSQRTLDESRVDTKYSLVSDRYNKHFLEVENEGNIQSSFKSDIEKIFEGELTGKIEHILCAARLIWMYQTYNEDIITKKDGIQPLKEGIKVCNHAFTLKENRDFWDYHLARLNFLLFQKKELVTTNEYANLIELFEDVIQRNKSNISAHLNIGSLKDDSNLYNLNINEITQHFDYILEKLDNNNADSFYERGVTKEKFGLKENNDILLIEAIQDYSQATKFNNNHWKAYASRGNLFRKSIRDNFDLSKFLNEGQTLEQQAKSDFNKALKIKPKDDITLFNRGLLFKHLKKYDDSINDFSEILKMNSDDKEAYIERVQIYFLKKAHAEVIDDCGKIIELDPSDYNAYNLRGASKLCLFSKDESKTNLLFEACQDFLMAIELGPDRVEARQNLNYLMTIYGDRFF